MSTTERPKLNLTKSQYKELAEALKIRLTPYIPHVPHPTQHAFLWLQCLEALYGGAAGGGKALALDTPIPVPSGWTTMGDLEPGDLVYGGDGVPVRVLACSDVMFRPCYRLGFSDGSTIVADEDHLWPAEALLDRAAVGARKRPEPCSTRSIAETLTHRYSIRADHGQWYITSCEGISSQPVRCIQVSAEDGLFLAGRQMVPTHNSDALLMGALQYVDVPGYNAMLLRKTYADLNLPGSLIPRSHEWLSQSDAKWNENDSRWTFPSGATLSFGYMRNDEDRHRYQSAEFQYVGFDELTHFSKLQYTYMFSRVRRPRDLAARNPLSKVPLRVRAASNPGGRGHLWVKLRFIKPRGSREDEPDDETQRVFIPAKLQDNPSVDAESYRAALEQLDESTQMQLIHGDWDAREPGSWVIPDPTWIDAAVAKGIELWDSGGIPRDFTKPVVLCIDWGEFTQAYCLWPMPNGGVYVLPSEVVGEHEDPASVGLRMLRRAEMSGIRPTVANYDAAGIQSMRTFASTARARDGWERLKTRKIAFGKYKRESMNYLRLLFRRAAADKPDRFIAIHPENHVLIRQLRGWVRKNEESEDVEKFDDHGCDALVAGVAPIAAAHRAYIDAMVEQAKRKKATQ